MKALWLPILLILASCFPASEPGSGSFKSYVIYGGDDRFPMEEQEEYLSNSLATAVRLFPQAIFPLPEQLYGEEKSLIAWDPFQAVDNPDDWSHKPIKLCPGEPFQGEITAGLCSGVLVAPDMILTAGHCVVNEEDCQRAFWAFDYRQENTLEQLGLSFEGSVASASSIIMLDQSKIIRCQRVLARQDSDEDDDPNRLDFALIQLDGFVYDRQVQPMRLEGKATTDQELALVGYPMGLPGKIALNAKIWDNESENFFLTDTDSFRGNSGSAVIDMGTKLLEGILVDGAEDYVYYQKGDCMVSKVLPSEKAEERVTRISAILKYIEENAEYGPEIVEYLTGQN